MMRDFFFGGKLSILIGRPYAGKEKKREKKSAASIGRTPLLVEKVSLLQQVPSSPGLEFPIKPRFLFALQEKGESKQLIAVHSHRAKLEQ